MVSVLNNSAQILLYSSTVRVNVLLQKCAEVHRPQKQ